MANFVQNQKNKKEVPEKNLKEELTELQTTVYNLEEEFATSIKKKETKLDISLFIRLMFENKQKEQVL